MIDLNYEIGLAELALVEVAGGTLLLESSLSAQGEATTTLIASAPSQSVWAAAGVGAASFPAAIVLDTGVVSTGTGVFTPEVAALVQAVLAASGAAVVNLEPDVDPIFTSAGSSSVAFAAATLNAAALTAAGASAVGMDGATVLPVLFTDGGYATTTLLGSASANTSLATSGATVLSLVGSAYGASVLASAGITAVDWRFAGVNLTTVSASGATATAFDFAGIVATLLAAQGTAVMAGTAGAPTSSAFAAVGSCTLFLAGDLYYDSLPRAWDYVIRPFELRGITRPSEIRGIPRPYEQRGAVRPAEDRDVLYS